MTTVFTLFFSRAFSDKIGDIPYPLFSFAGLLFWQMFSRSLSLGAGSLVMFEQIIGKVYFPRIIAPISMAFGVIIDFLVATLFLAGMMAYYGVVPQWSILAVPLFLLLTLLCSMGLSCLLAAIDVRYRDVRFTVPLLLQAGMFCTPVMYPSAAVPERWRLIYEINPMVGLTDWFRWSLLHCGQEPGVRSLILAIVITVAAFIIGVLFFQKVQGTLVDTL